MNGTIPIGMDYNDPNLYEGNLGLNVSEDNKTTYISVLVTQSDDTKGTLTIKMKSE